MDINFNDPALINGVAASLLGMEDGIYARHLAHASTQAYDWGHYYEGVRPQNRHVRIHKLEDSIQQTRPVVVLWSMLENSGFLSPFGLAVAKRLKQFSDDKDQDLCPAHL